MAKYLPGARANSNQALEEPGSCEWDASCGSRTMLADVTIYGFVTGAHGAEQAFDSYVTSKPEPR